MKNPPATPLDLPNLLPDVLPIPQDDGPRPLAQIAYTETYSEAMSYLRALMSTNELSPRTLKVTEYIIKINPAHYTCWGFRLRALFSVAKKAEEEGAPDGELGVLKGELEYLNGVAVLNEKNYQIWHHRQMVMDRMGELVKEREREEGKEGVLIREMIRSEHEFTAKMFDLDSKNYHVWSYRQWLVRRFYLFSDPDEIAYIESLLGRDVRNNSAWNHRFFIIFGSPLRPSQEVVEREVDYTQSAIFIAPQNPSPWNYLRGIFSQTGTPLSTLLTFCHTFAPLTTSTSPTSPPPPSRTTQSEEITSSHALDLLAEIYAEKAKMDAAEAREGKKEKEREREESKMHAVRALELLAERFDPIRAGYWDWRKRAVLAV